MRRADSSAPNATASRVRILGGALSATAAAWIAVDARRRSRRSFLSFSASAGEFASLSRR